MRNTGSPSGDRGMDQLATRERQARMDFSLDSDQKILRDTVRQFMETEMRPVLRAYEREERFPAPELRKLGELGCCGMLIPDECQVSETQVFW